MIIFIQKMPRNSADYFRYFPVSPDCVRWGLGVTAAGCTRIAPHSIYPPPRHPTDHQFDWERGRVLEAVQIILITAGKGWFETKATGRRAVTAGTAFLLLPKVWHRYRPDPETGWEESWIEIQGPVVESLRRAHVLTATACIRRHALTAGLDAALEAVHARIRQTHPGFDAELAARAMSVLAAWRDAARARPKLDRMGRVIAEAEQYLADHLAMQVSVRDLAKQFGVAYSHFRRAFKAHTGFAPWQYMLHLRLLHARRQLASSDATLDELAGRLGFSSGFHLSTAFKQAFGVSPDRWRRQFAAALPDSG
ncbi:MAG: AraC family transcriptional regulator [Opitutae bacterium]|nr:AraC family transcriptional regulator [Opitutae bacterium]